MLERRRLGRPSACAWPATPSSATTSCARSGRAGAEVELLRRADLVEVSQWTIRFGLERSWLRSLEPRLPRKGFVREVLRQLGVAARKRPATLWRIVYPG